MSIEADQKIKSLEARVLQLEVIVRAISNFIDDLIRKSGEPEPEPEPLKRGPGRPRLHG